MTEKFKNLENLHSELRVEYDKLRMTLDAMVQHGENRLLGNDAVMYKLLLLLHGETIGKIQSNGQASSGSGSCK